MIQKDTHTPLCIAALFTMAQTRKQPKRPSTEEWIKKMWYRYTMEYYLAIKKNEIMPFPTTWMELESATLNEISQRRRNILWCSLFVESKNKCYKWTYNTERDSQTREAKYSCWGEGIVRDFGKVMYTLLYLKWITNKNLLYNTWNSAQCYVPVGVGEGFGGEWIHVYVWLNPSAVHLKLSQHY